MEKIEASLGPTETAQPGNGPPPTGTPDAAGPLREAKRLTSIAVNLRSPEALGDALSAVGECDENDKELAGIEAQLDQLQSELNTKAAVDALDMKLGKAAAVSDLRARSLCLMQVAAESNQIYCEALLSEPAPHPSILKCCAALSEKASSALRDAEERKSRAYQEWALKKRDLYEQRSFVKAKEEIRTRLESFKHPPATGPVVWPLLGEFARFREFLSEKTGTRIDGSSLTSEQQARIYASVSSWLPNIVKNPENLDAFAYRVTREAFIKYLLPIDERLLDRPVQILFTKSFEAGWRTLDDVPEDQRFVAEQGVQIRKRTPDEILD